MTRTTWRKRWSRLAAGVLCLAAVWACKAPFIPVPPPGDTTFMPEMVPDGNGGQKTVWVTQGGPNDKAGSATFFVYDTDGGSGVITKANPDGSYVAPPMDGTRGDRIHVFYQDGKGVFSAISCQLLIEGPNPAPRCPTP
jgi:hypothetical protein